MAGKTCCARVTSYRRSKRWVRATLAGAVSAVVLGMGSVVHAQDAKVEVEKAVESLKSNNPGVQIRIDPDTGLPSSITGLKPRPDLSASTRAVGEVPSEEDVRRVVEAWFDDSGLTAATRTLNPTAKFVYKERVPDRDFPDKTIAKVEQRVNDIPVFGSTAKLRLEPNLAVTKFTATASTVSIADTTPTVTEQDAQAAARTHLETLAAETPTIAPGPAPPMMPNFEKAQVASELMVFDPAIIKSNVKGGTRLAWMVTFDNLRVFVDAKTREVFHVYQHHPTQGMIRRIFDLEQSKSPPGVKVVDEETLERANDVVADARTAFQNSATVRDFFFLVLGRNGFDDNDGAGPNGGSPLTAYVRHGTTKNAFWCSSKSSYCPDANAMVYGPGYAGALDIVGHEMTHGVIAHEADLVYSDEPGAVNESLADIFGALIEFFATGDSERSWALGEAAPGYSKQAPLRSMKNPHLEDAQGNSRFDPSKSYSSLNRGQPDHYDEKLDPDTDPLCRDTWLQDNGCVHFNSGILNKFAYLVADGGEHRGVTVEGIGMTKLARLTYRALTSQLNRSSGLIDAANAFVDSCDDFVANSAGNFVQGDCDQVRRARQAVGLIQGS